MRRSLLSAALALLAAAPLAAQPGLGGVLLGPSRPGAFSTTGISIFNPDSTALHKVGLTPDFWNSPRYFASFETDTLAGVRRAYSASTSRNPALSASGRMVFVADWFGGYSIVAQNRDATDRVVLVQNVAGGDAYDWLHPDISPDGQTVIYVAGYQLYRMPADGSGEPEEWVLPPADDVDAGPIQACPQSSFRAVFSPDGTQVAYLGAVQYRRGFDALCGFGVRVINLDGSGDRAVAGPFNTETGSRAWGWMDNDLALDWKADRILFNWPADFRGLERPGAATQVVDLLTGEILPQFISRNHVDVDTYQLSPDGHTVGYMVGGIYDSYFQTTALDPEGVDLSFETVFQQGSAAFLDWAEAPRVPEPARMELPISYGLVWEGRSVTLRPTLYATDGSVIVHETDQWTDAGVQSGLLNAFDFKVWGGPGNQVHPTFEKCASNGGFTACAQISTVNVPLFGLQPLDDDIAEDGRNPGKVRIVRYGRPDAASLPVFTTSGTAVHYLDYTLSALPQRLSFPAKTALADTLQFLDVTLAPIDDGVAEGAVEDGRLLLACQGGTGIHPVFGVGEENCATAQAGEIPTLPDPLPVPGGVGWSFEIQSNGAGSGLAVGTSRPERASNAAPATLTINGQGFAEGATATLSGPASLDAVGASVRHAGVQLRALFDLAGAPAGTYDLTVTSDGATSTLPGALVVEAGEAGTVDVWSTGQASTFRAGFSSLQRVHYGNDGTADAYMVPIRVAFPEGAEVAIQNPLIELESEIAVHPDSIWSRHSVVVPPTCAGGSGDTSECSIPSTKQVQVAIFYVPVIPAGGTGTLTFEVLMPLENGVDTWASAIGRPLNVLDFDADAGTGRVASGAALAAAVCVEARAGMPDAGEVACYKCLNGILAAGIDVLDSSCVGAAFGAVLSGSQALVFAAGGGSEDAVVSGLNFSGALINAVVSCGGYALPGAGQAYALYQAFSAMSAAANVLSAGQDCAGCARFLANEVLGLRDFRAHDPNDKTGPLGVGEPRFVAEFGRVPYRVDFENLATATASAVEVVVRDTLDTAALDLATFELGAVVIGDSTFTPPPGLQAWTTFWDRRPAVPSVVRIDAALDAASGAVEWQLSDLDPAAGYQLRTSEGAGFLPPEDGSGAGMGGVEFYVAARDGLAHGSVLANRATIRFDREAVIETGTWANTLDRTAPVSRAISAHAFDADTSWVVRFEGADDGAGVGAYDLYAQADGGPFELHAVQIQADSLVFRGAPGSDYGFFVLATDWAGNVEAPKTSAEARTDGPVGAEGDPTVPDALSLGTPYPNPARGAVVLQVGVPAPGPVRVTVFDVRGRQVAVVLDSERAPGWHPLRWDASGLASGVYVVRAEAGGRTVTRTLTVVR